MWLLQDMKIEQQHLHKYVHIQVNKEMRKKKKFKSDESIYISHQSSLVWLALLWKGVHLHFFFCTKKKIWIILCVMSHWLAPPPPARVSDREESRIRLITKPIFPSNPFIYTCTHSCRIPLSATQSGQAAFNPKKKKKNAHKAPFNLVSAFTVN